MENQIRKLKRYRVVGFRNLFRYAVIKILGMQNDTTKYDHCELMTGVLDYLANLPTFSVIQIGAHIGKTDNDPLFDFFREHLSIQNPDRKSGSKVILVEPVAVLFQELQQNYQDLPGIYCENVAIAEESGYKEFYYLGVDPVDFGYPTWLSQMGSLRKERMEELWSKYDSIEEYQEFYLKHRVVDRVKCLTVSDLVDKYEISELDLLQIDTEGYDFEILRTLDFERIRPKFINYERVHLHGQEMKCKEMLRNAGYFLADWGQDTLCVRIV